MKPVAAFVALCLAASVALAADTAEELFQKASDAWMKAKTVHLKDASSKALEPAGQTMTCSAELWLGEGGKLFVAGMSVSGDQKEKMDAVSDGTTYVLESNGAEDSRVEVAKGLGDKVRSLLVHGGFMVFLAALHGPDHVQESGASDLKMGADAKVGDRAAVVLEYTYKFSIDGDEKVLQEKLYVDKEKLTILRREFADPDKVVFTEEYPSLELDAAPPMGAFSLPPAPGK